MLLERDLTGAYELLANHHDHAAAEESEIEHRDNNFVPMNGGATGDLYLRVRLARHPDFSVREADLYFDLDLAPWEAVLGVQTKIPTLDGVTSLRVPAGTAAGRQLRLRGLGLPRAEGTRGDLYATVRIRTPAAVSAEERVLWEQLAKVSPFKPRSES